MSPRPPNRVTARGVDWEYVKEWWNDQAVVRVGRRRYSVSRTALGKFQTWANGRLWKESRLSKLLTRLAESQKKAP